MARSQICKKEVGEGSVKFTFGNGEEFVVVATAFSEEVLHQAMLHGLSQKLGDSYASSEGDVDVAVEKFTATLKTLEAGQWNAGRSETGGLWIDAIVAVHGTPREEVLEKWSQLDDEMRALLKKNPRVKAEYARIQAERAAAKAQGADTDDLDSLLG